ncbi:uncharacterized protein [Nicotiana tomentosiformis]|uniref:uncharacterized protein n=1 Tax=Nicotiana tomentosiformis TaxID=4098 RepID=UPI00388C6B2C
MSRGKSHSEITSQTSHTLPSPEEIRGAPAPTPAPVPPAPHLDAPGQKMRDAIQLLTRLVATQARRQEVGIGHADRAISARVRDFINLDPQIFTGADPNEDPQSWELSRGEDALLAVWQDFTEAFLSHYFPPELRRSRVDRFLTLRQGNMSVQEYNLWFDSLARYAPTIIAKMEDRVHRFVMGLEPHSLNDCMLVSFHPAIEISCIQAYDQGVEECKQKQRADREHDRGQSKRARSSGPFGEFRGGHRQQYPRYPAQLSASAPPQFSGRRFDRSTYLGPSQSSRASRSQYKGESSQMRPPLPRCAQYGKHHVRQCLVGLGVCYTCGYLNHVMRDCPTRGGTSIVQPVGSIAGSSSSVRPLGQGSQAPVGRGRGRSGESRSSDPHNRIYALVSQQDQESSPDVVTGILSISSYDVYVLIDPDSTLSYVTLLVASKFGIEPELIKPFEVSTPVGDPVIARRVYRDCIVGVLSRSTVADLIEIDMI